MEDIEDIINKLPPDLQEKAKEFVNFLIERRKRKHGKKLRQDLAGALRDYRSRHTPSRTPEKGPGMAGRLNHGPRRYEHMA